MTDAEIADILIGRLKVEKDKSVLVALIDALGKIMDGRAVRYIVPFLNHKSSAVRDSASNALTWLSEGFEAERVKSILSDPAIDRKTEQKIKITLKQFGSRESVGSLLELYRSDNKNVVRYAGWALNWVEGLKEELGKHIDAGQAVRMLSVGYEPVRDAAIETLGRMLEGDEGADHATLVAAISSRISYAGVEVKADMARALSVIGSAAVKLNDRTGIERVLYGSGKISDMLFELLESKDSKVAEAAYSARLEIIRTMSCRCDRQQLFEEMETIKCRIKDCRSGSLGRHFDLYAEIGKEVLRRGNHSPLTISVLAMGRDDDGTSDGYAEVFHRLSDYLMKMGDEDAVKAICERCPDVVRLLGCRLEEGDRYEDALVSFHEALCSHGYDTMVFDVLKESLRKDSRATYNNKKAVARFLVGIGAPNVERILLDAMDKGVLLTTSMVEIYKGWSAGGRRLASEPFVRGDEAVFPSCSIDPHVRSVAVGTYRAAVPRPEAKEVTFVFDCSGSMKDPIEEGDPLRKFDRLSNAFTDLMDVMPDDESVTYRINTFGAREKGPSFEVEANGTEKSKLRAHMEDAAPGGASFIWANIEHAVRNAREGGVVIVYSDGRSDTSYYLKQGDHEFEGRPDDFDLFRRGLIGEIEAKNLQVHLISGSSEATADLDAFERMSDRVKLSQVKDKDDMGKILKDVATTKTLEVGDARYGFFYSMMDKKIKEDESLPRLMFRKGDGLEVKRGVEVDEGTGLINVRDVEFEGADGKTRKLGIEEFDVAGKAEYRYSSGWTHVADGEVLPHTVTLNLDSSTTMGRKRCFKTFLSILKEQGESLSEDLVGSGAKININIFNDKEDRIELLASDDMDEIYAAIYGKARDDKRSEGRQPEGYTNTWHNVILSIVATPPGGDVVTYTDSYCHNFGLSEKAIELAKIKKVKLHFIHYDTDYSRATCTADEVTREPNCDSEYVEEMKKHWDGCVLAMRLAASETGGVVTSFESFGDIGDAFEQLRGHLQAERGGMTVPLPEPECILIPIRTKSGEELLLKHAL